MESQRFGRVSYNNWGIIKTFGRDGALHRLYLRVLLQHPLDSMAQKQPVPPEPCGCTTDVGENHPTKSVPKPEGNTARNRQQRLWDLEQTEDDEYRHEDRWSPPTHTLNPCFKDGELFSQPLPENRNQRDHYGNCTQLDQNPAPSV